jgi:hypothetical protein
MPRLKRAVVQASSRSWADSPDESVALFEGKPLFIHTLQMLSALPVESLAVSTVEAQFDEIREDLKRTRNIRSQIALADFHDVHEGLSIPIADMISFHYVLALDPIGANSYVAARR